MKTLTIVIALIAAVGPFDCGEERTEEGDLAKLAEMEAQIDALIGSANCRSGEECEAIGFGAKPCGGPWKYKVYSESIVSTEKLTEYVDAYNAFNRRLNEKYGWISDCMVVSPPQVECRDGRCQAAQGP